MVSPQLWNAEQDPSSLHTKSVSPTVCSTGIQYPGSVNTRRTPKGLNVVWLRRECIVRDCGSYEPFRDAVNNSEFLQSLRSLGLHIQRSALLGVACAVTDLNAFTVQLRAASSKLRLYEKSGQLPDLFSLNIMMKEYAANLFSMKSNTPSEDAGSRLNLPLTFMQYIAWQLELSYANRARFIVFTILVLMRKIPGEIQSVPDSCSLFPERHELPICEARCRTRDRRVYGSDDQQDQSVHLVGNTMESISQRN
jgi:hypothetical protein